jgi:HAD superfamily hydrolase (TIGR01509 family)
MLLANRLEVPDDTAALLFDMDGVVLDTLSLDLDLAAQLLRPIVPHDFTLSHAVIRANFPYEIPEFWRRTASAIGHELTGEEVTRLTRELDSSRLSQPTPVHEGIAEVLKEARAVGLRIALVSNNPGDLIEAMIDAAGLSGCFDLVVGNDIEGVEKKPAPDPYLEAARRLGVLPGRCVAIEDSLLGARSAAGAGCFTVGVATGAADYRTLSASADVSACYTAFEEIKVSLGKEGVTKKSLVTPNEFVSHMIEHIAWRTGCSVDVRYPSDDWTQLGRMLGREVRALPRRRSAASALGMIDDGSCEVTLHDAAAGDAGGSGRAGRVTVRSSQQVDLEWFLSVRCEQMADGRPLLAMLDGLAAGGELDIDVNVASFEDPHHTWEAVFRGVGIAIDKLGHPAGVPGTDPADTETPAETPAQAQARPQPQPQQTAARTVERGWDVLRSSSTEAAMQRETAESIVRVGAAMDRPGIDWTVDVADSIQVEGLKELLAQFALGAGLRLDILFRATRLSSSHVVAEDIGMVLGRVVRQIALERMESIGVNGAGSSIQDVEDLLAKPVRVGVSMEGRKFCKYVPLDEDYRAFRRRFLIGSTLANGIFSEDLDDFVDGFAGGMQTSVIVHFAGSLTAEEGWPTVFRGLGEAVREVLSVNRGRRRLIAGVKATLA